MFVEELRGSIDILLFTCLINRIRHRCLKIGARIVMLRGSRVAQRVIGLNFASCYYSSDRYDTRSNIQTTMYYLHNNTRSRHVIKPILA